MRGGVHSEIPEGGTDRPRADHRQDRHFRRRVPEEDRRHQHVRVGHRGDEQLTGLVRAAPAHRLLAGGVRGYQRHHIRQSRTIGIGDNHHPTARLAQLGRHSRHERAEAIDDHRLVVGFEVGQAEQPTRVGGDHGPARSAKAEAKRGIVVSITPAAMARPAGFFGVMSP